MRGEAGEVTKAAIWGIHEMLSRNQDNQEVLAVIKCLRMFK